VGCLIPLLAQAQEADTALTRIRQNKAMTIGYRECVAGTVVIEPTSSPV
jgi:hypothetical protein